MKKYYLFLALLGLFLGYSAKYNFWFEDARNVFFPITKETIKQSAQAKLSQKLEKGDSEVTPSPKTMLEATVKPQAQQSSPVNLDTLSRKDLFHALYNAEVLTDRNQHKFYFEKIKSRLMQKYPKSTGIKHVNEYEIEVVNRLGILRALAKYWQPANQSTINPNELKKFFHSVALKTSEPLMIRRQAYKNWLSFGNTVTAQDKKRFIASNDSKLLHLISISDETLIQSLMQESN